MTNTSYSNVWFCLPFLQLGIKAISLTWVEPGVQILKRDWEENKRVSENFPGKIQLQNSPGMAEWLWWLHPWLSWAGSALRFASRDKQHPKNRSVGGTSLVCPDQGRGIPAGWDCSGLCPVTFGRALSMETDFIFTILLALKKKNCNKNNCNNIFCNKIYVNDESVSWSPILTNEVSNTCKFNCELMIIKLRLFVPCTVTQ